MATATVRIPAEKRDILKVIASLEKKEMKEILSDLRDGYREAQRDSRASFQTRMGRSH